MNILKLAFVLLIFSTNINATVIDFEDLTTRDNFTNLNIAYSYQGYEWGYGNSAGIPGRTWVNSQTGWASATASSEAVNPEPGNLGGSSYAWNWNGAQSLWIDFRTATDFLSGNFAFLSSNYGYNASSVQLFGYDWSDSLVGTSAVFDLSSSFQNLIAGFTDIRYLEIRANSNNAWFSIDDLEVSAVPVPAAAWLFGSAMLGFFGFSRRKNQA